MSEVDHLLSKKVADRYLKREVLGEGTYGVVYKAIDTKVHLGFRCFTKDCLCPFQLYGSGLFGFTEKRGNEKMREK